MIHKISKLAFERDKRKASSELTDFFVKKNNQEKAWYLITAVMSSLKQKIFTSVEAQNITAFLSKKFDIRRPAIQLAQSFCHATTLPLNNNMTMKMALARKQVRNDEVSEQLFLRLQAAVQDDIINYSEARSMVREIIAHYPNAHKSLQR